MPWKFPNFIPRNPLGVIALFISLIYGFAVLLLGNAVAVLSPVNQDRLTWFIILFPPTVLIGFLWLVSRHHTKLYAPRDYRSDDTFLSDKRPETIGPKLQEEMQSPASTSGDLPEEENEVENVAVHVPGNVALTYLAEGLALQEMQRLFRAPVRRELRVWGQTGAFELDAAIETERGPIIIEVKLLHRRRNADQILKDGVASLRAAANALHSLGTPALRMVLCVVLMGPIQPKLVDEWLADTERGPLEVRVFEIAQLLKRYRIVSE